MNHGMCIYNVLSCKGICCLQKMIYQSLVMYYGCFEYKTVFKAIHRLINVLEDDYLFMKIIDCLSCDVV